MWSSKLRTKRRPRLLKRMTVECPPSSSTSSTSPTPSVDAATPLERLLRYGMRGDRHWRCNVLHWPVENAPAIVGQFCTLITPLLAYILSSTYDSVCTINCHVSIHPGFVCCIGLTFVFQILEHATLFQVVESHLRWYSESQLWTVTYGPVLLHLFAQPQS